MNTLIYKQEVSIPYRFIIINESESDELRKNVGKTVIKGDDNLTPPGISYSIRDSDSLSEPLLLTRDNRSTVIYRPVFKKGVFVGIDDPPSKNRILSLKTKRDLIKFNALYGDGGQNYDSINWDKLSKLYAGFEVVKYFRYTDESGPPELTKYFRLSRLGGYVWNPKRVMNGIQYAGHVMKSR